MEVDRDGGIDDVEGGFGPEASDPPDTVTSSLFPEEDKVSANLIQAADSGQNDRRFYTLNELAVMEPIFERKFCDGGSTNSHNAHELLSPKEYRAKLYWLDQENRWKDIGTGRFRLLLSKDGEEHYIQVVAEDCIDDSMPIDNDIDKLVDVMVPSLAENISG